LPICAIAAQHNVLFFSDTTQMIGKESLDLTPVDICCFSAHRLHGPKGIGGVYIRRKSRPIQIEPLITGGKQENSLRGGTYNTAAIAGMGKAFEMLSEATPGDIEAKRKYFENRLIDEIEETTIHAAHVPRLCNTSNILFKHVRSVELMSKL